MQIFDEAQEQEGILLEQKNFQVGVPRVGGSEQSEPIWKAEERGPHLSAERAIERELEVEGTFWKLLVHSRGLPGWALGAFTQLWVSKSVSGLGEERRRRLPPYSCSGVRRCMRVRVRAGGFEAPEALADHSQAFCRGWSSRLSAALMLLPWDPQHLLCWGGWKQWGALY